LIAIHPKPIVVGGGVKEVRIPEPAFIKNLNPYQAKRSLRIIYIATEKRPAAGREISQAENIFLMTPILMAEIPLASPTPIILPTATWVVETGMPRREQIRTVVAVPNSAEKPRVGVMEVIFFPTVSITR